jgi:hypothetical protein
MAPPVALLSRAAFEVQEGQASQEIAVTPDQGSEAADQCNLHVLRLGEDLRPQDVTAQLPDAAGQSGNLSIENGIARRA